MDVSKGFIGLLSLGILSHGCFFAYANPVIKKNNAIQKEAVVCKDAPGKPCPKPPAPIIPVVSNMLPINLPLTPAKILFPMPQFHKLPIIQLDGRVRFYDFQRTFDNPHRPNQRTASLGGFLNLLSAPIFTVFRLGTTFYTANTLNDVPLARRDLTLPGKSVSVLGQAFAQYQSDLLLARVGNQLVVSPWVGPSDIRMIPATYQGGLVTIHATSDIEVTMFRLNRFKSRTSSNFSRTNLYNPINYGGTPIPALGDRPDDGSLALGGQYKSKDKSWMIQGWGYQFYDFAKMFYGEMTYMHNPTAFFVPLAGIQYNHTGPDGTNVLAQLKQGKVNSVAYGAMIGAKIGNGQLAVGYNNILRHPGAFKNGDIVSPYTTGYATDPLYSTSMIQGLVEKAAGSAYKFSAVYQFFDKQLLLKGNYANYSTHPFMPNTNETDFDIVYTPVNLFTIHFDRSLSLRYRVGMLNGLLVNKHFLYSRIMIEYGFA